MARKKGSVQRSLEVCDHRGWMAHKTEQHNTFSKSKSDMFGIIDLVVIQFESRPFTIGIQATMDSGRRAHIDKILAATTTLPWLRAGNGLELWSWGKKKGVDAAGRPGAFWRARRDVFTTDGIQVFYSAKEQYV